MEKTKSQILESRRDQSGWATREDAARHFAVTVRTIRHWNENWEKGRIGKVALPFRRFGAEIVRIAWAEIRQLEARGICFPSGRTP
ncbi:MAG TPA: hypothetical protein VN668_08620 [Stellaceae bacterium]|nr:hypothetical protein [Stellaceae bacterium]